METLLRLLVRCRPAEGWLLWLLALATVLLVAVGAGEAGWVPHLGLLLSAVMIIGYTASYWFSRTVRVSQPSAETARQRGLPGLAAAALLALLGLLVVSLLVGWREAPQVAAGTPSLLVPAARAGLGLGEMAGRLAQWVSDVRTAGQAGQDDAIFRWLLGMVAWAAAAWAAWWLFARQRTLVALLPVGLLLASNAYFFWDGRLWLPFFLAGLTLVGVLMQRWKLEQRWQRLGMDYSVDVRLDILLAAGGMALLVMLAGFAMPRVVLRPTADWFAGLVEAPVNQIERTGQQLFPGLRRAPGSLLATGGRAGAMPRAHLLTDGPELGQEVVMRVSTDELAGLPYGVQPSAAMQHTWRALTFDSYDGRGWRNSPLTAENFAAGEPWGDETLPWRRPVRQSVTMERGGDRALYAAGEPLAANRPYELLLRGAVDNPADAMAAMLTSGRRYQVLSLVPVADESVLRAAGADYPPDVAALYLALPDLPERVSLLAQEVTSEAKTPYDQALALEAFLRGFAYDLEIEAPPAGRDVVDYFLFDAQAGYCDYYASAMVAMARSLGIPARLAVGYATGAYDPTGRAFVVREENAHSWPELYFPGVGWVRFEPTAAQPEPDRIVPSGQPPVYAAGDSAQVQAGLQTMREDEIVRQRLGWLAAGAVAVLLALIAWVWQRRRPQPELAALYGRLGRWGRRLGQPARPGDSPSEFGRKLSGQVQDDAAAEGVQRFVHSFEAAQYSPRQEEGEREARWLWPEVQRLLRAVWWRRWGRRNG
ncbi:MAG TPA: transglutaminase domain-containing protein [Anaerolineae bacterium]|nr:transglutaminase domain-containing protein [Anaerolineae bacterium]